MKSDDVKVITLFYLCKSIKNMTEERFKELFETTTPNINTIDDNVLAGLLIIKKYVSYVVRGAEHDKLFSCSIEELCNANITEEDVIKLRGYNWGKEYDYLYAFV